MTMNLKMRQRLGAAALSIPSIHQFMTFIVASQVALSGVTVSASEIVGSHRHTQISMDDDDIQMPRSPIQRTITVQPAPIVQRTPPAIVARPVLAQNSDEAAGAEHARRFVERNPLAPVPSAIDRAPVLMQPLVAVTSGLGSVLGGVTDAVGDGLGLHRWDQMSLKELSRRYSQNPTVARTMDEMGAGSAIRRDAGRGIQGGKLSTKSTNRCFMYVQLGLAKGGLAPDAELRQTAGVNAKNAGVALSSRKYGFVNLLDMPQFKNQIIEANGHLNLPMGAVLVYGGYGAGHIEMRTPTGYASDYVSPHSRTSELRAFGGRVLTGVYIRPDLIK